METTNEIQITGVVCVPENVDADKFTDEFIEWVESKGYTFGGGIVLFSEDEIPY